ncbi:MAG: methyltransferase [Armatimonadetes bacterium]|nr:methyltransferase [Armatimonadota bacterium]
MSLRERVRRRLLRGLLPPPVTAPGAQYSMVYSAHEECPPPGRRLVEVGLEAARLALDVDLSALSARLPEPPDYPAVWPGEHYKLLAGLMQVLQPAVTVEIGTGGGHASLVFCDYAPEGGRVVTFDLVPWQEYPGSVLRAEDFADGRLVQWTDDLRSEAVFEAHRELLEGAGLIFLDAAKDGQMEPVLLDRLGTLRCRQPTFLLLDDTRVWNMLAVWQRLRKPKLDLTSLGHWSGTGLVDWTAEEGRGGGLV